jgi:EmrB/QacA subfamily drug resistance transporter
MEAIEKKKVSIPLLILSLAVGTFMSALDTSVVNIALPVMQSWFHVPLSSVEWVVTSYLLVVSSLLLLFGRCSDLFGHRRVYLIGFGVFTAGSLLCGLSSGIGMLIACRAAQALGGAMMFSTSSAIITDNVPPEKRGKAFSVTAVAVAVACCVGPVAGGMLAGLLGWQSVFFINVPIGIAGIFLAVRFIPKDNERRREPFDALGAGLVLAALFLILLPLDQADAMPTALFAGLLVAGIAAAVLFVLHEARAKSPLLKLGLFKNRVFSASLAAAVFNYMAQFIMAFLAPFYLEKIRMLSPMAAGLLYIPMPLATMLFAPISGAASDKFDSRYMSVAGMGLMATGMVMLSFLNLTTPNWFIIVSMAIAGAGSGMFQAPNNSAVMGSVPKESRGTASGMLSTARNVGMVLGVAASGALFAFFNGGAETRLAAAGLSADALRQASFLYALRFTFIAAAVVAGCAVVASFVKGRVKPKPAPEVSTAS